MSMTEDQKSLLARRYLAAAEIAKTLATTKPDPSWVDDGELTQSEYDAKLLTWSNVVLAFAAILVDAWSATASELFLDLCKYDSEEVRDL